MCDSTIMVPAKGTPNIGDRGEKKPLPEWWPMRRESDDSRTAGKRRCGSGEPRNQCANKFGWEWKDLEFRFIWKGVRFDLNFSASRIGGGCGHHDCIRCDGGRGCIDAKGRGTTTGSATAGGLRKGRIRHRGPLHSLCGRHRRRRRRGRRHSLMCPRNCSQALEAS